MNRMKFICIALAMGSGFNALALTGSQADSGEREHQRNSGLVQKCPDHIKPDNPRVTGTRGEWGKPNSGIPLNTPIVNKVDNADGTGFFYFRMPLGYSTKWVWGKQEQNFDAAEIQQGNSWTFWMPERRYPEIPLGFSLMTQTHGCENGRPLPTDEQYLVTFQIEKIYRSEGARRRHYSEGSPEERWRKKFKGTESEIVLESGILTQKLGLKSSADLKSLGAPRQPPQGLGAEKGWGIGRVFYRHPDNYPFQFMFECDDTLQMLCSSQFYFPDRNLNIAMKFTRNHLDGWEDILAATLELLEGWEIDDPSPSTPR